MSPAEQRSLLSIQASALYGLGRYPEALEAIDAAIILDPGNQELQRARAKIAERLAP